MPRGRKSTTKSSTRKMTSSSSTMIIVLVATATAMTMTMTMTKSTTTTNAFAVAAFSSPTNVAPNHHHRRRRRRPASSSSTRTAKTTTKTSTSTSVVLRALPDPRSIVASVVASSSTPPTPHISSSSSAIRLAASAGAAFVVPSGLRASVLSALTTGGAVAGGIFAGSLHAISGPDHLAALIPRCCGLPWHRALRVGVVWGVGHGVSASLIGMTGYLIKTGVLGSHVLDGLLRPGVVGGMLGPDFDVLHHAGSLMELAIGASLIVIGMLGMKEAREWRSSETVAASSSSSSAGDDDDDDDDVGPLSVVDALRDPREAVRPRTRKRAVLLNGMLHGLSWDGAPSLAPAVAISTFRGSLAFLLSYALGTTAAMALATSIIGEGTRRAAGKLDRPNLPRDLSAWSSALAMAVGVVWCGLALR
ncbi:hypothetical protein ACHAW5_010755 [Stephanodiscus triporus]|uniref:Nickel/cobalt efflux system n=1 Tax=Stephanodiscus triporus TaxID=2934178 RepID=A0ABD3PRU7_9STRA